MPKNNLREAILRLSRIVDAPNRSTGESIALLRAEIAALRKPTTDHAS